jgi:integrase/recombinase XerD
MDANTAGILAAFGQFLADLGYDFRAIERHKKQVTDLFLWVKKPFSDLDQSDILGFYGYLETRPLQRFSSENESENGGLSERMIEHYVHSLRTFFNFLEQTERLLSNPMSALRFKKAQSKVRNPLTESEVFTLFSAAKSPLETAILHLLYSCGLRRSEVENLDASDLNFAENLLFVRQGKGKKRRVIPLTKPVKTALQSYAKRKNPQGETAFLLGRYGQRLRGSSIDRRLKKILEIANKYLDRKLQIYPHLLRHSIATHLLANGLGIEHVRDFLGHSCLESTQIYVKVSFDQVKKMQK